MDELASYQQGVDRLLDLAHGEGLTDTDRERIRVAVEKRNDAEYVLRVLAATGAEDVGGRLVTLMRAADSELQPGQVQELDELIRQRLPNV